jgi:1-acyl-sn-glycerol-3-phosphate acyltransferase
MHDGEKVHMIRTKNALLLPSGLAISFFQELSAVACRIFLKVFWGGYRVDTSTLPKLKHNQRYVMAGNHQSMIDPFAIFALIPFRQRLRFLPLKFMTFPRIYHRFKPVCYLLGCYPAHIRDRNHHTYGVEGSIKLLHYGYNICIFPEGTRTLQKDSEPKFGVVRILEAYPEAKLLLAHLEWTFTSRGKKHLILKVASAPSSLDRTDPKAIMDAIYAL